MTGDPGGPPPFLFFGTVPWHTPWLTEQNLAHALARSHPVGYIEPPRSPLTALRRQERARPRPAASGERPPTMRPHSLPPLEHPTARRLSRPLVRAQLARARRWFQTPAIAVTMRPSAELVGAVRPRQTVFFVKDWTPAGAAFIGRDGRQLEAELLDACRHADLVCCISEALRRTLADRGVASTVVRHGFADDLAELYERAPEPADLAALPRPRVGYTGRIDERLDFEALDALAAGEPSLSVVLVGPISPRLSDASRRVLARRENLVVLPARDRRELPGVLTHLDCCLLPYRQSAWASHGSPLKLWDYLYAGPPIVGMGYEVLREFTDHVTYVEDASELPAAVARALSDTAGGGERRRAFAAANTWTDRAAQLARLCLDLEPRAR